MAIAYPKYCKIKDRYCIAYYGVCTEYLLQLSYLRSAIEKEFPGIVLYIGCRQEHEQYVNSNINIITNIDELKNKVAYVRELKCNMQIHPVEQLLIESQISLNFLEQPKAQDLQTKKCVICSTAVLPTKPIPNIENIKKWATGQGYEVHISNNIIGANWVIGTENYQLFYAAIQGIRTTLIPTGLGASLYKKMFLSGEIFNL